MPHRRILMLALCGLLIGSGLWGAFAGAQDPFSPGAKPADKKPPVTDDDSFQQPLKGRRVLEAEPTAPKKSPLDDKDVGDAFTKPIGQPAGAKGFSTAPGKRVSPEAPAVMPPRAAPTYSTPDVPQSGMPVNSPGAVAMKRQRVTRTIDAWETVRLSPEELAEAEERRIAIQNFTAAKEGPPRMDAMESLREALNKQFVRDLNQREKELIALEERVKALRAQFTKRRAAMSEIVDLKLRTISTSLDGLEFPEEGIASPGEVNSTFGGDFRPAPQYAPWYGGPTKDADPNVGGTDEAKPRAKKTYEPAKPKATGGLDDDPVPAATPPNSDDEFQTPKSFKRIPHDY